MELALSPDWSKSHKGSPTSASQVQALKTMLEMRLLILFCLLVFALPPTLRKSPFVVQGGRQKVLVSVTLENKKENAYNTSLSLSFSRNLHLASLTPQVPWKKGLRRRKKGGGRPGHQLWGAMEKGCV